MLCEVEVGRPARRGARPALAWEAVRDARARRAGARTTCVPARHGRAERARAVVATPRAPTRRRASLPGRDWLEAVDRPDAAASTRDFEFDPERDHRHDPGRRGARAAPRRLPGLRPRDARLPARPRPAGALRLGLPAAPTRRPGGRACSAPTPRMPGSRRIRPQHGWVEFDPTNDTLADARYITLAWGADFADVVPLRGVILGGRGQTHGGRGERHAGVAAPDPPAAGAPRRAPRHAASPPPADGAARRPAPRDCAHRHGGPSCRSNQCELALVAIDTRPHRHEGHGGSRRRGGAGLVRFELGDLHRGLEVREGWSDDERVAWLDRGLPESTQRADRPAQRAAIASSAITAIA